MAILQVKNLPDELHAALAERARELGLTMSDYVTRLLERDLALPTFARWRATYVDPATPTRHIDVVHALDEVRIEYDAAGAPAAEPAHGRSV